MNNKMSKNHGIVKIYGIQKTTITIMSKEEFELSLCEQGEVLFESDSFKEVCDKFDKEYKTCNMHPKYEPFDIVIYKPTGERGLVKSCNDSGVFVLFRIQSTAQHCKYEDIEYEFK